MRSLYAILSVDRTATKERIRSSYRELVQRCHPDRQGGDKAEFQAIQNAYAVLIDDAKRKKYDAERAVWLDQHSAVDCPGCGRAVLIAFKGVGLKCSACKTPVSEWTAVGRIKMNGLNFLQGAADLGQDLVASTIDVAKEETGELLLDAQDQLFGAIRKRLGVKRFKKGGGR